MKNISKIISIVLLSFSILLLCYIFYRSQVFHAGILSHYYLKYYIIAFLFIILSCISFFIPKKLKINITIVFISTLIGLYLVEGYLTIKNKDNRFVIYKNNTGKDYDRRTKFEVYQDLKKEDANIVIRIHPFSFTGDKNLNYLPLSGLSNRKTIHCNENGYYSIYQSDRYGFNNPDAEWDKDRIEFFLVGDSLTHGACVNEPDTMSGNLRKLNNNENGVLNLGQDGNGPLIEYATLKEYLPIKKVKRVLWMYCEGNDLLNLSEELKNKILVNYLKDENFSQNLILKKQEIEKIQLKKLEQGILQQERSEKKRFFKSINLVPNNDSTGITGMIQFRNIFAGLEKRDYKRATTKFIKLHSLRKIIFHSYSTPPLSEEFTLSKEFKNILKLSNEFTKQNNSKLYFVYLPEYMNYKGKYSQDSLYNYKKVTKIVKSLEIPIIDLNKELFNKHKDPLSFFPFRKDGHFNELGYQLVAEKIFNRIKELEK